MRLNLTIEYKSLTPPFSCDLPDFTILTGINGVGKTHLLYGVFAGIIKITDDNGLLLNPENGKDRRYIAPGSLSPNNSSLVTKANLDANVENLWNSYLNFQHNFNSTQKVRLDRYLDPKQIKIIKIIAKDANKDVENLTSEDFYHHYPVNDNINDNVFSQNFSAIFKRYHYKYDENRYSRYRNLNENQHEVGFLSDEEFVIKYGEPPWDFVNSILKESNLNYYVNSPTNTHRDAPFELNLINIFNGVTVKFEELSSGEKVLMSLALALYNSKFDFEFPKILLMDEPDASLHPSMSKQFLNVLKNVFVKGKGVKVIITTHSPSTVALCDEDDLFAMKTDGQRIEKTTKDKALKILTAGVPSFSINYENRRQVFVESKNDVIFYEKVYDKLQNKLRNEISLNFISAGIDGSGNCDQVREVVTKLSSFGNKFIFGIIDWDTKNRSKDFVKVLGENKRYSIENYIFDPILICALLLRDKIITRKELGLEDNENHTDFKNLSRERLQIISNFLTTKISTQINPLDTMKLTKVKYVNNQEVEIPEWYLLHQGHDLEKHLKAAFHPLKKHNKEFGLKKEIIEKVIDDIPELIPYDILELLRDIQTY